MKPFYYDAIRSASLCRKHSLLKTLKNIVKHKRIGTIYCNRHKGFLQDKSTYSLMSGKKTCLQGKYPEHTYIEKKTCQKSDYIKRRTHIGHFIGSRLKTSTDSEADCGCSALFSCLLLGSYYFKRVFGILVCRFL